MSERREIRAAYDERGIDVYQAFKPSIVDEALQLGTFGKGFGLERMTWIKPSFAWMLYRSGYATKHRQERILKITLKHEGFCEILSQAVPTAFTSDLFEDARAWESALKHSDVRYQWDPERDLWLHKDPQNRALQVGIQGHTVRRYIEDWIVDLTDVTALAHEIHAAIREHRPLPDVPHERPYPVDAALSRRLQLTLEETPSPFI